MISRLILPIAVLLTALVLAPGVARGQSKLPTDIPSASDLTDAQKEKIRQFVAEQKAGLAGAQPEIKKSRNALLEPLQDPKVSVTFRLTYAQIMLPALKPLVASDRPQVAINVCRLAGELATTSAIEFLTDSLDDKRQGVRFEAASGFSSTFDAIERTAPAVAPPSQAIQALQTLKTKMDKEKDARVLEAYVLAFQSASKVPSSKLEGVRDEAVKDMSLAISAKAQKQTDGPELDAAFRRAVLVARDAVTRQAANEPRLKDQTLIDAAGMAGDLLANVLARIKGGELTKVEDQDEAQKRRADLALIVSDAERTVQWTNNGLANPNGAPDLKLGEMVLQGKDDDYATAVMRLIGPMGILTAPPFGFKDDRFVK